MTLGAVFAYSIDCQARADKPPAEEDIIFLEAGAIVPFAGDLYPPIRAARMGAAATFCQERIDAKIEHAAKIHRIEIQRVEDKAAIRADADARRLELSQSELDKAQSWDRSPVFVAAVASGITMVAIMVAAAFSGALQGTL